MAKRTPDYSSHCTGYNDDTMANRCPCTSYPLQTSLQSETSAGHFFDGFQQIHLNIITSPHRETVYLQTGGNRTQNC